MPTHKKAQELADAFETAYPDELPERLKWWCRVLGIDRVRFLRMMGMSPASVAQVSRLLVDMVLGVGRPEPVEPFAGS
jgi:hypothetical protein